MFTPEEIAAAVDQFLLGEVKAPRLLGGSRDVGELQRQAFDLVSVALMMRPDAYFYLVWLARNKALAQVRKQIKRIDDVVAVAPNTTRAAKKIEGTTDLTNAEAAILSLNSGLNARSAGVSGSIGPAVDRFRRSIEAFARTELTKNVVVAGDVVPTSDEVRATITRLWSGAEATHDKVNYLVGNIASAVAQLNEVKLPARTVRTIVSRIHDRLAAVKEEMEGDSAIELSRNALLDLLTMRSLLTKASGFAAPSAVLAPVGNQSAAITLLDSAGATASLLSARSGPYALDVQSILNVDVDGAGPVGVPVLGDTRAVITSAPLVLPGSATTFDLAVSYNNGAPDVVVGVDLSTFASGALLATSLDGSLANFDVMWDAVASSIEIRPSTVVAPGNMVVLTDTPARAQVLGEFMLGALTSATPTLLSTAEVAAQLMGTYAIKARSVRSPTVRIESAEWDGSDLFKIYGTSTSWASTSRTITALDLDLELLGVRKGARVVLFELGYPTYTVASVSGPTATFDEDVDLSTPPSALTFYYPLDELEDGTRIQVVGSDAQENLGTYRKLGDVLGGLSLEEPIPTVANVTVLLFTDYLEIATRTEAVTSSIEVTSVNDAATELGFTTGAALGYLSEATLTAGDLLAAGVRVGDILLLTSPSLTVHQVSLTAVDTKRVSFSPAVLNEAGAWTYSILNRRYNAYLPAQEAALAWASTSSSTGYRRLDDEVGKLIRGAHYTGSSIETALAAYRADLAAVEAALASYSVTRERGIDSILVMLEEQGMDRARGKLTSLEMAEFFAMSPDSTSYATHMMRQAAATTRVVAPTHKYAKSKHVAQRQRHIGKQVEPYDPDGVDDVG